MIVSYHVTHVSAGGVAGLNEVISALERNADGRISSCGKVEEYLIVRTCNRFEAYTATDDGDSVKAMFEGLSQEFMPGDDGKSSFVLDDYSSIKHLFRVICGLESLIVGEDQIQHQIRDAYIKARADGHIGKRLSFLFDHALAVGKRVRSETSLNKGAVSVGSAAVELAESRLGSLEGRTVAIFGAGDMATVIAKNLIGKGPETVFVSNRTFQNAALLAEQLDGTAVTWDRMDETLERSDLVLVATSAPHPVVHVDNAVRAMEFRKDRPLLMIDVSVPRNIEPEVGNVPNVSVETMDSLQNIAMENVARRTAEIKDAEHIIREELAKIEKERSESEANEIIRELSLKFSAIKERELSMAKTRVRTSDPESVLEDLSRSLVNNLTSELYINMRKASRAGDWESCAAVRRLFGLEDD